MYVPWTKRRKGRLLYPAEQVRAADSYYISANTAVQLVSAVREEGFFLPADHLLNRLCHLRGIPILWLDPPAVSQGSHTGRFHSMIQPWDKGGSKERLLWQLKRFRRRYLYPLFGVDLRKMEPGLRRALALDDLRQDS